MMWEAMMMLRLLAALGSPLPKRPGGRAHSTVLPKDTLKGAIRLSFAAYRLSLPISFSKTENHDRKIA